MVEATSTLDPRHIPVLELSQDEIAEARQAIAAGTLPANFLELHEEAKARNVFGHDAQRDRHGNYIEQGIGAKGHETANHFTALKKAEAMGQELPGTYDKAVAEIWKRDPDRARKLRLPASR
jgi:hypothetical protein